jgi:hypothetical protein
MLNKKTRVCFPLQSTLAKLLGVSDRAIRDYVAGLVARGHLRVRHRGRDRSSIYELILKDRNTASGHDVPRPEDTFRSCEGDRNKDRKSGVARPEVSRRKTGTVLPTEPTSEPSSKPEERGAPQARRTTDSSNSCSLGKNESSKSRVGKISDDEGGVGLRPPPTHVDLAIARAYRLKQQHRVDAR